MNIHPSTYLCTASRCLGDFFFFYFYYRMDDGSPPQTPSWSQPSVRPPPLYVRCTSPSVRTAAATTVPLPSRRTPYHKSCGISSDRKLISSRTYRRTQEILSTEHGPPCDDDSIWPRKATTRRCEPWLTCAVPFALHLHDLSSAVANKSLHRTVTVRYGKVAFLHARRACCRHVRMKACLLFIITAVCWQPLYILVPVPYVLAGTILTAGPKNMRYVARAG